MTEQLKTAYHDVGHAIAAEELGVQHNGVSIDPNEDGSLGRVPVEGDDDLMIPEGTDPYSPEDNARFQSWANEHAVIDYVGHAVLVALLHIGDMSDESAKSHGADSDFERARSRVAGDRARIEQAQARALEIVAAYREDIKIVAGALLKHGRLSQQQMDFVRQYPRTRPIMMLKDSRQDFLGV